MSEGTRNYGHASHNLIDKLERKMIDGHLHCPTCPEEDGIKGKWKRITEFYVDNEKSRGVTNRCKACIKAKRLLERAPPKNPGRVQVADVDALNKVRFQTSDKLEPARSLSTYLASKAWTKELTFDGVTG
jgi:hypothetical protein